MNSGERGRLTDLAESDAEAPITERHLLGERTIFPRPPGKRLCASVARTPNRGGLLVAIHLESRLDGVWSACSSDIIGLSPWDLSSIVEMVKRFDPHAFDVHRPSAARGTR